MQFYTEFHMSEFWLSLFVGSDYSLTHHGVIMFNHGGAVAIETTEKSLDTKLVLLS